MDAPASVQDHVVQQVTLSCMLKMLKHGQLLVDLKSESGSKRGVGVAASTGCCPSGSDTLHAGCNS
jgi:hypothetical protein